MKKLLMIGPFPGELNGQTIANQTLYEGLSIYYDIERINTLKETEFLDKSNQGKFILSKFLKILLNLFIEIKQILVKKYDVVYMTSGQSFLGFMRFTPYMLICIIKNIPYFNHIHGSRLKKMYDSQSGIKIKLLDFFIKKSTGMIVLGNSLKNMFEEIIDNNKIFICENGVQDDVVATEEEIEEKILRYEKDNKKRVLYLSNLMVEKGIMDLLEVTKKFTDDEIEFNLAGAIEPGIKIKVEEYLKKYSNKIKYHGIVIGEKKKKLLLENYILILPSYDEGQPICILEAYATGCTVLTDETIGGIKDIFKNKKNGLTIKNKNIQNIFEKIKNVNEMNYIKVNYNIFKKTYQKKEFLNRIKKIINKGIEK